MEVVVIIVWEGWVMFLSFCCCCLEYGGLIVVSGLEFISYLFCFSIGVGVVRVYRFDGLKWICMCD